MPDSTISDGVKLLAPKLAALSRRAVAIPLRFGALFQNRTPTRLIVAPQEIRTADPTIAEDIYAGYFAIAGTIVNSHGRSPFEIEHASEAWRDALAGFGWLRHLRAAETPLARANSCALVEDWIKLRGKPSHRRDWLPHIAARRLISFLSQSPTLLRNVDESFYRRFMRTLGRHVVFLEQALREGLDGRARLLALIALADFALCAQGFERLKRKTTRLLEGEISRQILADGGHISRNPQVLVDLLLDLLPLRHLYAAHYPEPPTRLFNALDRIGPMIRLFRHPSGDMALFNGMGVTRLDNLATVLSYDDARAQPVLNAPWSGYQRLEAEDSVLIADAGAPPPQLFSHQAHAGALSFEFSSGLQRVIVNCGAPAYVFGRLREAARATAAHSTLTVAQASSSRFSAPKGFEFWWSGEIIEGPAKVSARRSESSDFLGLEISHDGYARRFGLLHRRTLKLSRTGAQLEGEDELTPLHKSQEPGDTDFEIRFHLHPDADPWLTADEGIIELRLPDGQSWTFEAPGSTLDIEESIFFANPEGRRSTTQIVIRERTSRRDKLQWSLRRVENATAPSWPVQS